MKVIRAVIGRDANGGFTGRLVDGSELEATGTTLEQLTDNLRDLAVAGTEPPSDGIKLETVGLL